MRTFRRTVIAAVAAAMTIGVAACSGSGGSSAIGNGSGTAAAGQKVHGGTATEAWPNGSVPNLIFPLAPATNTDGYNVNLTQMMWPYLVTDGYGGQSVVDPQESLYSSLTYGNGDTTITIKLKPWKWSDGTPITSRDFTFVYHLLKANVPNWIYYTQGLFPDDVKSVQTPDASTIVVNLTRAYNPDFYTEDVLSEIPLLPQHAWDKESAAGQVGNYDDSTAGAKAVWNFLQKEGSDLSTFTTNPLWKVVDGPFTLASFNSDGDYSYVPNTHFSGTAPALSKVVNQVFTTDTAEMDDLRAGSSITAGFLPQNDVKQVPILKSEGYDVVNQPIPGAAGTLLNFYNAQTGPLVRQLYIRQALEDLIDRPQIVSKIFAGYADPGNGPVPVNGFGPWVSPLEKSGGPYPYDPAKAVSLLTAHGWKVTPNGASTCQSPGTGAADCGAGITSGEPLSFQLLYSSGTTSTDEEEAAIQSSEAQAGVKISLKAEPFNTLASVIGQCTASSHPASTCGWQLVDFGYDPYFLYPTGDTLFNTGGANNLGGYSSPEEDALINQTEYGSSPQAFFTYEDYTAEQLPWLWVPLQSQIDVYKSTLGGFAPLNPFSGSINPEDWYYTK